MTPCANCGADAVYILDNPGARPAAVCASCLPWHYKAQAASGLLTKANVEPPAAPEPEPVAKPKKKAEKPVEESLVVEAVVEPEAE